MADGFTTHATNFTGALQTGVDPRTCQFFLSFPLPEVSSHHLLGPLVSLGLNYSALSAANSFGLGNGVSLAGVSVYDQRKSRIWLSNGESWTVKGGAILNRKLLDCKFEYVTHGTGGNYVLHWKNGTTETLTEIGSQRYLTTKIVAPSGRAVVFNWSGSGRLQSVTEQTGNVSGQTIVALGYGDDNNSQRPTPDVTITFWPGKAECCQAALFLQGGHLTRLSFQDYPKKETVMQWEMEYKSGLLRQLSHPTGLKEEIFYQEGGLKFPAKSSLPALSAVSRHVRRYSPGQPDYDYTATYTHTDKNFLGFGVSPTSGNWDQGSDHLYRMLTEEYIYSSTETLHSTDGKELQEIVRNYDNYHRLISETATQGKCSLRKKIAYHGKYNTDIEQLPCYYHFPHLQTITWNDQQPDTTKYSFDDYGNPLTVEHADGTKEEYSWYAAQGEGTACPAEPHGFKRFLKERKVTAPVIDGFTVPVHREEHFYEKLGSTECVVQTQSRHYSDVSLLSETKTAYVSNEKSPEFGRVLSVVSTLHDLTDSTISYITTQNFATVVNTGQGRMTQTITHRSHDGLEMLHEVVKSVYTNLPLKETDAQGIVTTYSHDNLGRIVEQTHAVGTPYSTRMAWSYLIDRQGDTIVGPVTVQEDAQGRKSRTHFDGAGRAVRHELHDLDISKKWHTIFERMYNSLGQVVSEKHSDWTQQDRRSDASLPSILVETQYGYDGWGNQNVQTHADGTKSYSEMDPIGLTQTRYQEGTDGLRTGKVVTTLDKISKKPVKMESFTANGTPYSTQTHKWDGLGRMRESTDAFKTEVKSGNVTKWSYDLYGRVHEQTLPDGSVVRKTYAGHLTAAQATAIHVQPVTAEKHLAGTQVFDGLGRLKETATGGRKTGFAYDHPHSPLPEKVTLPSGSTLKYSYIPELGHAKKSVAVTPAAGGSTAMAQTFEYDAAKRQLVKAIEGAYQIGFGYAASGAIQTETFTAKAVSAGAANAAAASSGELVNAYDWTFCGLAESHFDVNKGKRSYKRDKSGRVTELDDAALTVTMSYDKLGRPWERKVVTKEVTPRTVTTTIGYDDFNRETTRILKDGNGNDIVSLTQLWSENGLLHTRKAQQGTKVLTNETFRYDKRNRLIDYTVAGTSLPTTPYGNLTLSQQSYDYDLLNNLTKVVTHTDKGTDTATFDYNKDDPTQLTTVHHTHKDYPKQIDLKYDAEGRMILDEAGRTLGYDGAGRLIFVKDTHSVSGTYEYDALNRLVRQTRNDGEHWSLYYLGDELVNEVAAKDGNRRFVKVGHACLAVAHRANGQTRDTVILTGDNQNNSVVWTEEAGKPGKPHAWSPYGHGETKDLSLGFNGERIDPISRTYHLGNGYRAYNPTLMRFNAPDSLSPFGPGGINPYAYCAGDPINHTDPSGHISVGAGIGIGLGVVGILGGVFALFTGGASLGVAGAIAGAFGLAADGTGIASAVKEESDPRASATLGWVSLGLGIASGMVGASAAAAKGLNNATAGLRGRFGDIHKTGLSGRGATAAGRAWANSVADTIPNQMHFLKLPDTGGTLGYWVGRFDRQKIGQFIDNDIKHIFHQPPEANAVFFIHGAGETEWDAPLMFHDRQSGAYSPRDLAGYLKIVPGFNQLSASSKSMVLGVCYAGEIAPNTGLSLAQSLANETGVKIWASKSYVAADYIKKDGHAYLRNLYSFEPFELYTPRYYFV